MRWMVDDRPPTPYTRAYVKAMWWHRDKEAFEGAGHTLQVAQDRQRQGDRPPTRLTRLVCRVRDSRVAGMTTWVLRPRAGRPRVRVLYVHGGGYIHPLTADYWRLFRSLVRAGAEVVVPAYPLAPEATVDEVLPRLLEVYDAVDGARPGLPTVLMGDSAGGALVIAMATELRDQARGGPAAVVPLSPWLDATLDEDRVGDLEVTDPMLAESGLRAAGRWWSGPLGPERPVVSPVNASLRDLPPMDLFIGEQDILRPAVDRFAERAVADGADLTVHEHTAMFHVWMTRAIPEARRTRRELRRLVREAASYSSRR